MTEEELNSLGNRAVKAFEEERFDDEASIWEQIVSAFPDRHIYLSNLASARLNQGRLEEALDLFDEVIQKAPHLSRAYNNRAVLLLRMGTNIHDLIPAFGIALETSHDWDDFGRHLANLCHAAAYGPDSGGMKLLDAIEATMTAFVETRCQTDQQAEVIAHYSGYIEAFRHLRRFREAIAERRWSLAKNALNSAREHLKSDREDSIGLGVDALLHYVEAARHVFELLERISDGRIRDAHAAHELLLASWSETARLRKEEPEGGLSRLLDVLGWFLTLFLYETKYLASKDSVYSHIDDDTQVMIWLSSSSFRRLGDDLISVLNSGDKICRQVSLDSEQVADTERRELLKSDGWSKLCLAVSVRVFDLQGIDAELARSALRWRHDPVQRVREEMADFRTFVERQAFRDVFVDSRPQENIARALLQARLRGRSYREVPTRAGRSDLLLFSGAGGGRILIEAKIWRGAEYFEQGLHEMAEYVKGENDDTRLLGAFYMIFDPTVGRRAIAHIGSAISVREVEGIEVSVIVVNLCPELPSRA